MEKHIVSYQTYFIILIALIILTAVSAAAVWFDFKQFTIAVTLLIASVKVFLVLSYFMHLKYDSLMLKIFVGLVFVLLLVVFVLLYADYWFR